MVKTTITTILILLFTLPVSARDIVDIQVNSSHKKMLTYGKGDAELIMLNKDFHRWYILRIKWPRLGYYQSFHLENPYPHLQKVTVSKNKRLLVLSEGKDEINCDLLSKAGRMDLRKAVRSTKPFVKICSDKLFLRNQVVGDMSTKEVAVDFMRDHIWGGEDMISKIKDTIYKDAELITADVTMGKTKTANNAASDGPAPALVSARFEHARTTPGELGIKAEIEEDGTMFMGKWYRSKNNKDIYVGVIQAQAVHENILNSYPRRVLPFDSVEPSAMIYLVAFDLTDLEIGYSVGTEHPKVSYSERTASHLKVPGWPGPDGIGSYFPLAGTGRLNPYDAKRAVATFTGGFKRKHSVFRAGAPSRKNGGTHYGFVQNGVVFSTLHPGLATAYVDQEGVFRIKTWTKEDKSKVNSLMFARQNGLPLVYRNSKGKVIPGKLVRHNFRGNWSGSKQNTVRALRTGLCAKTVDGRRFITFAYFSAHTPNAMARVFQAYGCDYAMHLDMNMMVHTYLATYHSEVGKPTQIEHIVKDMHWKDRKYGDHKIPRFVVVPDNRDFFYLLKREKKETSLTSTDKPTFDKVDDGKIN